MNAQRKQPAPNLTTPDGEEASTISAPPAAADSVVASGYPLWSKRLAAMIFLLLTVIFLISIIYDPGDQNPYGKYRTICMFKNLTGMPCPGCGLTHSFCEIGKGDLADALAWNAMGIPVFVFAFLVWLKSIFVLSDWQRAAQGLDRAAKRVRPLRLFAIAFVLYGVGRILYILFFLRPPQSGQSLAPVWEWLQV